VFAVVKTGGKQYRVEVGQTLQVEKLPEEIGATVALEPLLYSDKDVISGTDGLSKVTVSAKIVNHFKDSKQKIVKFKPKRGYRRNNGHRQLQTELEITEIKLSS